MLNAPPGTTLPRTIYVATNPVNMRKSFDGLAAVVKNGLQKNPLDGTLYTQSRDVSIFSVPKIFD